ncbi:MAG: hypothetical protein E6K72_02065 [Candidatus Eisenbacteria bacterium]|uniref:Anti-sigma-28 factor FlgM C-terminal domain-containing protein n=1 Tax=Eiseniibacteriota bacterium TaxID=2212470 RepID=A0A538T5K4_UNCEI|nr:MAG: hypothetical protein E6K72_02065 [Candidatus Eisenbacteria bacterium]
MPIASHSFAGRGPRPARAARPPQDAGVRDSLVESARARLAAGYYDLRHVRTRIAEAVMREFRD